MKFLKWALPVTTAAALLGAPNLYAQKAGGPTGPINPNTLATATYFDAVCQPVINLGLGGGGQLSSGRASIQAATQQGQSALFNACNDYFFGQRTQQSVQSFIEGIDPTGFISFKLDTLLFAQGQSEDAMDRLQALRNKHSATVASSVDNRALGGGASADQSGDLLGKKLGLWFRVDSLNGSKDQTLLTGELDSSQFGGVVGVDYRLNENAVIGGLFGYRSSDSKFGAGGAAGKMESKTINFSGYFSSYLYKNLYLDAVVDYSTAKFDTRRNVYDLSAPPVLYSPDGKTNGTTVGGSVAMGYEFSSGGWTLVPSLHYRYIDSKIDAFAESGVGPFDLAFAKQNYKSSSARLDFNVSYAINSESAVWLPHFRAELIKEFGANIDTFDVRLVNEDLGSGPVQAPLTVQMDKLDDMYYRASLGVSAQFHNDVSGYLEYQQLIGFDQVNYHNIALGVRFQF